MQRCPESYSCEACAARRHGRESRAMLLTAKHISLAGMRWRERIVPGDRIAPRVRMPSACRWRRDLSNDSGALVVVKCLFDVGNLAHNWPIPENRCGQLLPRRVWRVEDCIVPEVSLFHATIRCRLPLPLSCSSTKFLRNQMVGIPELLCSGVGDSCKCATTGGTPIRGEDRLPHHEHLELRVRVGAQ